MAHDPNHLHLASREQKQPGDNFAATHRSRRDTDIRRGTGVGVVLAVDNNRSWPMTPGTANAWPQWFAQPHSGDWQNHRPRPHQRMIQSVVVTLSSVAHIVIIQLGTKKQATVGTRH